MQYLTIEETTLVNDDKRPLLSIVIPAHNEERRLPPSLEKIDTFLKTQPFEAEVIVVENGSTDRTVQVAQEFAQTHPNVRVIEAAVRGKGLAVKVGMLAARGEYRFICDADLSMPIEEIVQFLPPNVNGYDIVIASREGKGARRIGEPQYRHIIGRINNWIIKLTALRGFEDTQCGFKMFNRKAAEDLFGVQQMTGIGFDIELLFIAKRRGYKIKQVPITWYFDPDSRMRLIGDSAHLLVEIWQIRRNWLWGVYAKKQSQSDRQS
ncbi:MAG: glycosyltransferase family 2 protein [Chloroflexi bacterium]|nr:glycosyltransferase family 2 protein [Chloroflexota bacterium]